MTVAEAMAKLESAFATRPIALFRRIGGSIRFTIVTSTERQPWVVHIVHGHVVVEPGVAEDSVVHIGIVDRTLVKWIEGHLDVEEAFKKRRLAVEGDLGALDLIMDCLTGGESALSLRAKKRT